MQVDVSDTTMGLYWSKVAYTVAIVTVRNNPHHAFASVRSNNHVLWDCHFFQNYKIILSNM